MPIRIRHAHATASVLLGLALAGDAGAEQRSLTEIISESFEESESQTTGASTAPETTETMAMETATASATPIPLANSYPSGVSSTAPSTYDREQGGRPQTFDESVRRAVDGFHELVIPARHLQAIPPADPDMDCVALYNETTRLLALGQRNRPSYSEDPKNIAIGVASFVFPAATYLLGVTAYAAWYEDQHQTEARRRAGELRSIMADRRCFARD